MSQIGYHSFRWQILSQMISIHKLFKLYEISNYISPRYICNIVDNFKTPEMYPTHFGRNGNIVFPRPNKDISRKFPVRSTIIAWNKLPPGFQMLYIQIIFQ